MKWAIAAVGGPSGSPGKLRFRLPSSSGEQRAPASAAGRFWARHDDQAPLNRARVELPDQAREHDLALVLVAVIAGAKVQRGPAPFLITAIGMPIQPYAETLLEYGSCRWLICLPFWSKSTKQRIRVSWLMGFLGFPEDGGAGR